MNKTSIDSLVKLANNLLFENIAGAAGDSMYINNSRMGQYDTPGPQTKNDDLRDEEEEKAFVPVVPTEVVNNQSLINVNYDIGDKSFVPDNSTELSAALASEFSDLGINDLTRKQVRKIWKSFKKIVDEA